MKRPFIVTEQQHLYCGKKGESKIQFMPNQNSRGCLLRNKEKKSYNSYGCMHINIYIYLHSQSNAIQKYQCCIYHNTLFQIILLIHNNRDSTALIQNRNNNNNRSGRKDKQKTQKYNHTTTII